MTLRGTPFIFQGQEIGMTNFHFKKLEELNDVESYGMNSLMKKLWIPKFLRWRWIKASSRDNARTPMHWNDDVNAGFSKETPWLSVNPNYKTINHAAQKSDPDSILNFYKTLIALRKKSECLIYGGFIPVHADDRLMVYQRKLGGEIYTVALNFSSKTIDVPKRIYSFLTAKIVICTSGRTALKGQLLPWEGVLVNN
jgi:oligo-1,6-glucosidase